MADFVQVGNLTRRNSPASPTSRRLMRPRTIGRTHCRRMYTCTTLMSASFDTRNMLALETATARVSAMPHLRMRDAARLLKQHRLNTHGH